MRLHPALRRAQDLPRNKNTKSESDEGRKRHEQGALKGFKGKKELALSGNIGEKLKRASGRKMALNNKQAHTHPDPHPVETPAAWLAPEPRGQKPRATWFRLLPPAVCFPRPSPSLLTCSPTAHLSNPQCPTWLPRPASYLSGGSLSSPQYHNVPTDLGPQVCGFTLNPSQLSFSVLDPFGYYLVVGNSYQIPAHTSPGDLE